MKAYKTSMDGLRILIPKIYKDERGFFFESYNNRTFNQEIGSNINFVQDNHSKSSKGTLRGLHYQIPPRAQGKLIRVIRGEIFDVVVDLRRLSKTFGKWIGVNLSEHNNKQLWVPEGFAHGFLVISDIAECLYKTTEYYSPEHERGIIWDDKELNIEWPININKILISKKDSINEKFKNVEYF